MAFNVPTIQSLTERFASLLPQGLAWTTNPASNLWRLISSLMPSYQRVRTRANDLIRESFPGTAVELLPEWEASLGLPDPCLGTDPTIAQRQASAVARLSDSGGPSKLHLLQFAENLGINITIQETSCFNIGVSAIGGSDVISNGDQIFIWKIVSSLSGASLAVLECEIARVAPAQTTVVF